MSQEHRDSPRFRVYLPIHLDGIELTANNISSSGMQFSCPEFLLARIQNTLDQDNFDLDIELPLTGTPCTANVKTIYNSAYGEEQLIGIEYVGLEDHHQKQLSAYLQNLADKNVPIIE